MSIPDKAQRISEQQARANILKWMESVGASYDRPCMMSRIGYAAFPAARFKSPQGAAMAVSRIVRRMCDEGILRHGRSASGLFPASNKT